jgi:DNA relaxase NicK
VFDSLEKMVNETQMAESQKKEIVAKEIAAFKKLKQQVEAQYSTASKSQNLDADKVPNDFKQAMNAVERRLNSQVADLKEQLAVLQKELDSLRTR